MGHYSRRNEVRLRPGSFGIQEAERLWESELACSLIFLYWYKKYQVFLVLEDHQLSHCPFGPLFITKGMHEIAYIVQNRGHLTDLWATSSQQPIFVQPWAFLRGCGGIKKNLWQNPLCPAMPKIIALTLYWKQFAHPCSRKCKERTSLAALTHFLLS